MKKIVNSIVAMIIVILILMVYLTFNIDKNIKLRYWLSEHFQKIEMETNEASVYFLGLNDVYKDSSKFLINSPNYINLDWLKEIDATYQYDTTKGILSVIWNGNFLVIEASGEVTLNNRKRAEVIDVSVNEDQIYVTYDSLNQLEGFSDIGIRTFEDENSEARIIMFDAIDYQVEQIESKSYLFKSIDELENSQLLNLYPTLPEILSPLKVVDKIKPEDQLIAYDIDSAIALIFNGRTIGYGPKNILDESENANTYKYFTDDFYTDHVLSEQPIFLIWEAVYSKNPDTDNIPSLNGVNVVSPTWIELKDSQGTFTEKISSDYLKWSSQRGYETWILATNAFDPDLTHDFLISYSGRKQFSEALIKQCLEYGIDGINLDFENIYLKDKDILSHFVNELAWYCNAYDVTFSMDVTVMDGSDNWSKCFDRRMLGKAVDYLIIMTYDEYWASSPTSGPVSSYDWVESSLIKIMNEVPSQKLIMGLPFYTRVWTEQLSNDTANKVNVSSKSIGMTAQNALIEEKGLNPIWNEQDGLFYVSYIEEDSIKKIWVENEVTLSKKASLVKSLNLKGIACWRRGLEEASVYDVLLKEITK